MAQSTVFQKFSVYIFLYNMFVNIGWTEETALESIKFKCSINDT